MEAKRGRAVRTTAWRRFCTGISSIEIVEKFHDSACNIPEYANLTHDLIVDILRGRLQYYLNVKEWSIEQVSSKCNQPAAILRQLISGVGTATNFAVASKSITNTSSIEKNPRPRRSKKTSKVRTTDEAQDKIITTLQAVLDGEIDSNHTEIVFRGLCRYAHEERLPFASKLESGLSLINKIPSQIAILGVLDIVSE